MAQDNLGTSYSCVNGFWVSSSVPPCRGTTFCNSVHGSFSVAAGSVSNWTVPVGVKTIRFQVKGGNGTSYLGGAGSYFRYIGTLVVVSGGGGGSGLWDGDQSFAYAGAGGMNGAGGAGGGGWNGGSNGAAGKGGNGGVSSCGYPAVGVGGLAGAAGTSGAGAVFWATGGVGGGGVAANFAGSAAGWGGGGGGGFGGGGGGSASWCGYSYMGGGGGGGGYRSPLIVPDVLYGGDSIDVATGSLIQAGAGNWGGYVNIIW